MLGLVIIFELIIPIQVKEILTGSGTDTYFPLAEQIMYCIKERTQSSKSARNEIRLMRGWGSKADSIHFVPRPSGP